LTALNPMSQPPDPELSLVVPTYNERENIQDLLCRLEQVLADRAYEIIVVDDDSPDRTWELVEDLRSRFPRVKVERRREEKGLAQSILTGFRLAKGGVLGCMDADGSHPTEAIPDLLAAIENGSDMAVGSRYTKGGSISGWPAHRLFLSRTATALTRYALRLPIRDPMSGFYFVRREVFERAGANANSRGYKVLPELYIKGHPTRVAEVPIHFQNRRLGESKLTVRVLYRDATSVLGLIKLQFAERAK